MGHRGVAAVFRDHLGNILAGSNSILPTHLVLDAEANAIREALIIANTLHFTTVIIESDNRELIQALKSETTIWEIRPILEDICKLKREMLNCGFTWILREGNQLAHEIAKLTIATNLNAQWCTTPTMMIRNLIIKDKGSSITSFLLTDTTPSPEHDSVAKIQHKINLVDTQNLRLRLKRPISRSQANPATHCCQKGRGHIGIHRAAERGVKDSRLSGYGCVGASGVGTTS
ncbi:hypothetical protein PIB30_059960 [Stylosanthes scabra]|uniref:RNase H type-1 domain-containing protein n=1 Tax=Stylosanthes scabra TaxID=79078 RepID=A0ABU6SLT6_9FABA|nr:hypothetical protein [Stylosanthes scabra]